MKNYLSLFGQAIVLGSLLAGSVAVGGAIAVNLDLVAQNSDQPTAPLVDSNDRSNGIRATTVMNERPFEETLDRAKWAMFFLVIFGVVGHTAKNMGKK